MSCYAGLGLMSCVLCDGYCWALWCVCCLIVLRVLCAVCCLCASVLGVACVLGVGGTLSKQGLCALCV